VNKCEASYGCGDIDDLPIVGLDSYEAAHILWLCL
jgi:hypothetical protein